MSKADRVNRLPAIPHPATAPVEQAVEKVKEILDVGLRRKGNPMDGFVRYRDLVDAGIAKAGPNLEAAGPGSGNGGDDGGGGLLQPPEYDEERPTVGPPQNVTTASVWDGVMVKWSWPDTDGGQLNYTAVEVWASQTSRFEDAELVGTTTQNFFLHDNLGFARADELQQNPEGPATGYRWYWVRFVNSLNPLDPYSDYTPREWMPGVRGNTASNPEYVLELLSGQITESQLYQELNQRIDLVDCDPANPGQRIGDCVQSRINLAQDQTREEVYAAVAEFARAEAGPMNARATYGVHLDANGYVVGFGLTALADLDDKGDPTEFSTSEFIVVADKFAVVDPQLPGAEGDPVVPFIAGSFTAPDGTTFTGVGINGELLVDGTVTANAIQAGSVGADQINADEVWSALVNADRIISGSIATSNDELSRVVISNPNRSEFPLWYGRGAVSDANGQFWVDRSGNLYLNGTARFNISDSAVILNSDQNALEARNSNGDITFRIDKNGNTYAESITIPEGTVNVPSGDGSLTLAIPPGRSRATVLAMATCGVTAGSEAASFKLELLVDGTSVSTHTFSAVTGSQEFTLMGKISLSGDGRAVSARVRKTHVDGGAETIDFEKILLIQVGTD